MAVPNILGPIALLTIQVLEAVGMDAIDQHERELTSPGHCKTQSHSQVKI
jgi:selenocysteine lyase/cysteine desulfurase